MPTMSSTKPSKTTAIPATQSGAPSKTSSPNAFSGPKRTFDITDESLRVALGMNWTTEEAIEAIQFLDKHIETFF